VVAKAREASTAASTAAASASTAAASTAAASASTASADKVVKDAKESLSSKINNISDNDIKENTLSLFLHLTPELSKYLKPFFEFKDVLDTQNSDDVIISKEKKILPDSLVDDSFKSFLNVFGFPRPRPANPPAPAPAKNDNDDVVLIRRRLSPIFPLFPSFRPTLLFPSPVVNYSPNRIGNYLSSQSSESNLFPALPRSPRGTSPKSPRMGRKRGGFYEKYMKYKAKYIALKKQLS